MEQLEILHTSHGIAVFRGPILSSADVAQHFLDFVVAQRVPSVVHEDSVLDVSRILGRLDSILLMSPPLPKFVADVQQVDLLSEIIAMTVPSVRIKSCICFMLEMSNMHLHMKIVRITVSCHQSTDKILPRSSSALQSGSEKFSLLMKLRTSSRHVLVIQSFSCSLCNQLNSFLKSRDNW